MSSLPPTREALERLARHSDWRPVDIRRSLTTTVYADRHLWLQFAHYLLLGAGVAFLLSGVVFFFAYNWAALPRLAKLGTAGGVLTVTGLVAILAPLRDGLRRVLLTATVVLIGVLLAVLGQVYQTGADSFQLFLLWSVFALPWVALVAYAPLWLILVVLLNTTLMLYTLQVGVAWELLATGMVVFVFNVILWAVVYLLRSADEGFGWLIKLIALWTATVATINTATGSLGDNLPSLTLVLGLAAGLYAYWVRLGLAQRSIFYLAVVGCSAILTVLFLFLRSVNGAAGLFILGFALVGAISLLVRYLQSLNRDWRED